MFGDPDDRGRGNRKGIGNLQQGARMALDLEEGKTQIVGSWETVVNDLRTKRKMEITHHFEKDGKYSLTVGSHGKSQQKSAGYWELIVKNDSFQVNIPLRCLPKYRASISTTGILTNSEG